MCIGLVSVPLVGAHETADWTNFSPIPSDDNSTPSGSISLNSLNKLNQQNNPLLQVTCFTGTFVILEKMKTISLKIFICLGHLNHLLLPSHPFWHWSVSFNCHSRDCHIVFRSQTIPLDFMIMCLLLTELSPRNKFSN